MQGLGSSPDRRVPTAELVLHFTVVGWAALSFAWWGYRFSWQFERGEKWDGYAPGLQPGSMLGRRVDLSDVQWREFRHGMPAMAVLFAATAALMRLFQRRGISPMRRAQLCVLISLAFLGYLHGACIVFVLGLIVFNFGVAQLVAGHLHGGAMLWVCNLGTLFAARIGDGFQFSTISKNLARLDNHRGVMRWEICFNMSMLRMLSYALDLHWRRRGAMPPTNGTAIACNPGQTTVQHINDARRIIADDARWRQRTPLPSSGEYGLFPYLAYVLYAPLYLAGPIITYQDYAWQLLQQRPPSTRMVVRYGALFAADWLCLELVTHCLYFNSIAKHRIGLRYRQFGLTYGTIEMAMTAFWVLCFMWLKFTTIWRFFRLAALFEGLEPPENMQRCFANNFDIEGFWRGWHSSYNQWLVRYLYIPLGGSRRRALVIWPIFLFVALWHDLEWQMLSWAWLICLAFMPELLAKRLIRSLRYDGVRHTRACRFLGATGAALNISALMAANLAGFVLGLDGLREILPGILHDYAFVATTMAVFFCAANVMFWIRSQSSGSGRLCMGG